jgi:hypothetical protein
MERLQMGSPPTGRRGVDRRAALSRPDNDQDEASDRGAKRAARAQRSSIPGPLPRQRRGIQHRDNTQLNRFGLHNGLPSDKNDLYEKWESLAVVPVGDPKAPDDYFLFVGSDNDFITQHGFMAGQPYVDASGGNVDTLVLVYRVTLPTYVKPKNIDFEFTFDRDRDHDRW